MSAVCRVCLVSGNIKMYSIENTSLAEVFERLTTNKLVSRGLSTMVCYMCRARLQRCRSVAHAARHSQTLLLDTLRQGHQIAESTLNRESDCLSISILDRISISSDEEDIDTHLKQETDIKEEIANDNIEQSETKTTTEQKTETKNGKYVCARCPRTFYRKGNLEKHIQTHTHKKLFVCVHCNKRFKQRSHLNVHMRIHTGEKLYACEICGKTFNQIANLNKHKSIHSGVKPYSCEVCNKPFLQRAQVKAHLRTHTGEKPYVCNRCDKAFSHAVPLRKHMKLHIDPKRYICTECYHSFDEEIELKEHYKVHSERSFKCGQCESAFKDRRSLSRHEVQVHCGERQHVCARCGNAFKRPQHLNKHMASAHCKLKSRA